MKWTYRSLGAGALAVAMLATAGEAGAVAVHRSYNFETRMVEQQPGVGEYDGSLQLDISARGYISGYYRPADNPRFLLVTGGLSGDKLWLDIGNSTLNPMRFSGTLRDGKIDAVADRPLVDQGSFAALELIATAQPR